MATEYRVIIRVFKDGTAWCAVYSDFKSLHESPAGFGHTRDDAVRDLITNWTPVFSPQVGDETHDSG